MKRPVVRPAYRSASRRAALLASGSWAGLGAFSSRLPEALGQAPWARACCRAAPHLDLTRTLPGDIGMLPPPVQAWLTGDAAHVGPPHGLGEPAARDFLASALEALGSPSRGDRLMLTTSTSEAYALLIKLVCSPGEAVAVCEPGYPLVPHIAALEGVRALTYRLLERSPHGPAGWRCDLTSLQAALAGGARLVAWVAPHNPTGHLSTVDEARAVAALCRQWGAALVVDEVFRPFVACDWSALEAAWETAGKVFYIGGLSKWAGMPHLKLGWIRVGGRAQASGALMARLAWMGDGFLSVNQPVQAALPRLWAAGTVWRQQLQRRLQDHRRQLDAWLAQQPGLSERAVGGWMSVVRGPPLGPGARGCSNAHPMAEAREEAGAMALECPDAAWAVLLAQHGVRVHPGFLYDLPTWISAPRPADAAAGRPRAQGSWVTSLAVEHKVFAAGWRSLFACVSVAGGAQPALG